MKTALKVLLGLVAVAVIVVLIAVPVVVLKNRETVSGRTYTLEDYFNDSITYKGYRLRWISDTEYLLKNKDGNVMLYDVEKSTPEEFLSSNVFTDVNASDYIVSADRKFACLQRDYQKVWRHSYTASYSLYDLETKKYLTDNLPKEIQYIEFSPTGHKLAFIWKNNVYLKLEPYQDYLQVTTNGKKNEIYNGIPDWVYEEEVFSSTYGIWWSPGGQFLAYVFLNDTAVERIEYSYYGNDQYPKTVVIPYPKANSTIPIVKLFVVETTSNVTSEVTVPDIIGASDHYMYTVTWVTDERIAVQWTNRSQNYGIIQICDYVASDWNCSQTRQFVEEVQSGWLGQYSPFPPHFTGDNESFYKILSDRNGYKHIHYLTSGKEPQLITSGEWEVIYIVKVTKDALYYVSNQDGGTPGGRNLYKITIGSSHSDPQCMTCNTRRERCKYNSAYFSKNATYYRMDCSGPGIPIYTLNDNTGKELRILEENKELEEILKDIQMPTVKQGNIQVAGFKLWYQMTLPPSFDKSKKYPLLIDVYAGPCSQKVDYRFRLNWASYLASTEKIIVASFDGRGSGYQGDRIMHALYRRLGTYEVEDQITAARKFIDMGFIDKKRVAIWGWSYGGYVTSMVLGSGSGVFKCGIAVAPVSKWEYYDAVYTERYMGRPIKSDNLAYYQNSTVTERAANFKSVNYLLIHGTADDNVHFQQAAQISKALVDENVDFETMWYTDKDHGLDGSAHRHVYIHMSHFLKQCFSLS
ncbi:dipeptidyl peptidase 4 [Erpetoichthys calabaricus]|uniref:dipeptidyl peptidase 4 n=1 Tax=Erpetoichthys calabaricus TaxID=27687 RepID=UPI0022345A3C|nr:dipeptidyl peptidase 4 [Erpetoichthys calabaricus]